MARLGWGALAAIAAGLSAPAQAADVNHNSRHLTVKWFDADSWAGLYLGGNFGYAWGSVDNAWAKPSGFIGGVQAGYNWQPNSRWVFGVEADIQGSSANDTFANWKFSNPWFGTVRGRGGYAFNSGGYAFNNVLFYGTLGLAFGQLRAATFGLSESHTNVGWTAGVGAEYGFAPGWSAKIEYLYVDLANSNFVITGASHGLSFGVVRAGVNYRFSAR